MSSAFPSCRPAFGSFPAPSSTTVSYTHLRVLEEKTVTRIGASKLIDVDVRIIAATNKNLLELVEAKEFREDLYYRINVLPLYIPPLRERIDDLRPLMNTFMDSMGKKMTFSDEAAKRLLAHRWKGNVRELRCV